MLTTQDLIDSLRSDFCPICKGHKHPRHTMCGKDYRRLPAALKRNLYNDIWSGYAQAVDAAMRALGVTQFWLSPTKTAAKE